MAKISQDILSSAWYKNLAAKAPADALDKASIQEVHASAREEIDNLKAALQAWGTNAILNEHFKDAAARKALLDLIEEGEKTPANATPTAPAATPTPNSTPAVPATKWGASGTWAVPLPNASRGFTRTDEKSKIRAFGENAYIFSNSVERAPQDAKQMVEAIKANYALMKSKQQENYIQHADDWLMWGPWIKEYEHAGRTAVAGLNAVFPNRVTGMINENSGDNVLNYSTPTMFGVLDSLANQVWDKWVFMTIWREKVTFQTTTDRDKAILTFLNDANNAIITEDDSYLLVGTALGWYPALLFDYKVLKALIWSVGKVHFLGIHHIAKPFSFITDGIDSVLAKYSSTGKGLKWFGKWAYQKFQEKRAVRQAAVLAETPEAELSTEQKELKAKQLKMVDDFLLEDIYTRNRVEIARGGIADLEGFKWEIHKTGISSRFPKLEEEFDTNMKKATKYFPLDFIDKGVARERFTALANDLNPNMWRKLYKALMDRFILSWIDTKFELSKKAWFGDYARPVQWTVRKLSDALDRIDITIEGQTLEGMPRTITHAGVTHPTADVIKWLYEHISADFARQAINAEVALQLEIATLDREITDLKNTHGLPDTEEALKQKQADLAQAKRELTQYQSLHDAADAARTARTSADGTVTTKEWEKTAAETARNTAKANHDIYNEYGMANTEYDAAKTKAVIEKWKATNAKWALLREIQTLETILKSQGITVIDFIKATTDADFTIEAKNHISGLQGKVAVHNSIKSIDVSTTFGGANTVATALEENITGGRWTEIADKAALLWEIQKMDATLKSQGIPLTDFRKATTDADFTIEAKNHISELQGTVAVHNGIKPIDVATTFGGANTRIGNLDSAETALEWAEATQTSKKAALEEKIQALKDKAMWDTVANRPNTDGRTLKTALDTAQTALDTATTELTKAEAEKTKRSAAVDKVKAKIAATSIMKNTVNQPVGVDAAGKKIHSLKTQTELDAEIARAQDMKTKLAGKARKIWDQASAATARTTASERVGISPTDIPRLKPLVNGSLSADGDRLLGEILDKLSATQTSFDTWASRLPAGYTTELRDGKMIVKEGTVIKATIDLSKPGDAAKMIEKLTRR